MLGTAIARHRHHLHIPAHRRQHCHHHRPNTTSLQANGENFAKHVNCTGFGALGGGVDIDCLLKVDAHTLLMYGDDGNGLVNIRRDYRTGQIQSNFTLPYMDSIDKSLWAPTVDGNS